jgi:hypothetical protein
MCAARHQAALYGVMRAVGEQLNPPSVARAAVEAIVRLVVDQANWQHVSLALPDDERSTWVAYTHKGQLPLAVGAPHAIAEGIVGRAFTTGQTQGVPRVGILIISMEPPRAAVAVPLRRTIASRRCSTWKRPGR